MKGSCQTFLLESGNGLVYLTLHDRATKTFFWCWPIDLGVKKIFFEGAQFSDMKQQICPALVAECQKCMSYKDNSPIAQLQYQKGNTC